jgi:hypothetical protein
MTRCVCVCVCVYFYPFAYSQKVLFVRILYLFKVQNRTTLFVCGKAWLVSCGDLFLGVFFFFPLQLIAERTFSHALCGWLKGQNRSAGWYSRRVVSVCKSGWLLRRLHVLPIRHANRFFVALLIAVETSSLELCIYSKPKRRTLFVREKAWSVSCELGTAPPIVQLNHCKFFFTTASQRYLF